MTMFDKLLIANRGEISVRIQKACRKLGVKTVAVYSQGDEEAPYLADADECVCIGPANPQASYLNIGAIILAAVETGAQTIHPGYGFLSENADFAEAVELAGLTFVGPSADCIRIMGDKVAAKQAMLAAGVPCVPGSQGALPINDPKAVSDIAQEVGYPVIIKASGGGGGRGMRVVKSEEDLASAVSVTGDEAQKYFGNPELYLEKYLETPRHIEIQVMCDTHGTALWLGDRDCSMQRRHQKLIEEAPAPGVARAEIAALGERCATACRQVGYTGAGTFEFLYENGRFYFIEMNTRIQVEHPVTEMVTGFDLVAMQIQVASGEALAIEQQDVPLNGHSIECRINAENPDSFVPSPGTIIRFDMPEIDEVRFDHFVEQGYTIPSSYDSLIAKLIVTGATRNEALEKMSTALASCVIEGPLTNIPLHQKLIAETGFKAGGVNIHHLEKLLTEGRLS